jgi:hypothetical protein
MTDKLIKIKVRERNIVVARFELTVMLYSKFVELFGSINRNKVNYR